jgi:hypothetical protein
MASRREEKERRRRERLARERAEAAAAARRRRLQLAGGALLAVLAVGVVVVAVVVGLGGNDSETAARSPSVDPSVAAKLPAQETSDYEAAAKAAGCKLENPAYEGADHEEKNFTAADYRTNPPTSGTHFPDWYDDGVYAPGDTSNVGMTVHTLEHGRIDLQYKKGTDEQTVARLEALVAEQNDGYHMLLFENATNMPYAVAATAWTHLLGCPTMNDKVFDAIRTFRARYIDKGPENVP